MHIELSPYTGITDFTDLTQVRCMLKVFKSNLQKVSRRKLHVGVMMSYKTLWNMQTKWSQAFSPKETIRDIFHPISTDAGRYIYNCLHYADYEDMTGTVDLAKAFQYAGPFMDAIQLDMPWPDHEMIDTAIRFTGNNPEVILQVGKRSIEEADNDPNNVVERLKAYDGIIHRVLLDKSMGKGLGMDAEGLLPYARAIKKAFPHLGLVVAGGLGPNTMHLVHPLVEEFPDISIDAQGKLRASGNALDPIDWDMAEEYLVAASKILK